MGDSENSNNDDNDKDDHNESGSIFGKQCSASFKANKTGTLGSLLGIETAYNELQLLLPFSDDLATVAELLEPSFQYFAVSKILIFIKKKAQQSDQDLPTISTILTEEKMRYKSCPHPVTF